MRRRRVRPRRGVVTHRQFAESAEPAEQARVGDRRIGGELGGREREGRRRSPGRRDEGDGQGHLQDLRPRSESLLFQSSSSSSSWSRHVSSRFAFVQRVCCRSPPPPHAHTVPRSLSLSQIYHSFPPPFSSSFFFFRHSLPSHQDKASGNNYPSLKSPMGYSGETKGGGKTAYDVLPPKPIKK